MDALVLFSSTDLKIQAIMCSLDVHLNCVKMFVDGILRYLHEKSLPSSTTVLMTLSLVLNVVRHVN